jgi:hypothetical protein
MSTPRQRIDRKHTMTNIGSATAGTTRPPTRMSVLIVGAGAAGGDIGSKLVAAGRETTFLVRTATRPRLTDCGIQIRSADGALLLAAAATMALHNRRLAGAAADGRAGEPALAANPR